MLRGSFCSTPTYTISEYEHELTWGTTTHTGHGCLYIDFIHTYLTPNHLPFDASRCQLGHPTYISIDGCLVVWTLECIAWSSWDFTNNTNFAVDGRQRATKAWLYSPCPRRSTNSWNLRTRIGNPRCSGRRYSGEPCSLSRSARRTWSSSSSQSQGCWDSSRTGAPLI
jgi:hypothetical protein